MAEDRLPTMMRAYRKAVGRMAEAYGPDWVEHDHQQRVWRQAQVAQDRYHDLPAWCQRGVQAFLAGVAQYMAEFPDRVPKGSLDVGPAHLIALARGPTWGYAHAQAWGKLERAAPQPDDGSGSNQWVVAARRSAEGHVITHADPHVSWENEWLWYECHLHGGDLHVYGYTLVGLPYVTLGHNEHLSWSFTAGGPDMADVYELALNPEDPTLYRYDGQWRTIECETYTIPVKTPEGMEPVTRETRRSHHGPILRTSGNVAYAFRNAYAEAPSLLEQAARFCRSTHLGEFLDALSLRTILGNVMVGDVHGNLYYQLAGMVPIRPAGFDWTRPVPGNTSRSEWLGYHPSVDLVQILNPPAGWMQNCNVSPGTITEHSPLTADRYPAYLYNNRTDGSNARGRRASHLLSSIEEMTLEDAIAVATDTYVQGEASWRAALYAAHQARVGSRNTRDSARGPHLEEAIEILRRWDGRAEVESAGMTLFRAWWSALDAVRNSDLGRAVEQGQPLPGSAQEALLTALDEAARTLQQQHGHLDVPWGTVYRARRGEESWPVSGIAGRQGLNTLHAVYSGDPDDDGVSIAGGGPSCTTVVMLKAGDVRSYSAVPYGQSEDPTSAHYTDQGRLLFSKGELKDTWFSRERLQGHVEGRTALTVEWGQSA